MTNTMTNNLSPLEIGLISPYPTVFIVITI